MLLSPNKPHNGRAKDGQANMWLGVSERMVRMVCAVGCGARCSSPLAAAGAVGGYAVCLWTADRLHVASCRWRQRRLRRLLLLPGECWPQERIAGHAIGRSGVADAASARAVVGSDRRLAHQAIRSQGRGSRHPSQSNSRTSRSEVLVWSHLGHTVALGASPLVGAAGLAAAHDVVCSPADDSHDPPAPRLEVSHRARVGRAGLWSGSL